MSLAYFRNLSQGATGGLLSVLITLLAAVATLPAHAQTEAVLYNFCSLDKCVDGQNPVGHIVGDSAGNIYGTTSLGGQFGQGVLYKVNPSGVETILHEFGGTTNDGKHPNGVFADAKGNLYGTTTYGGSHVVAGVGLGTLFKMTPSGSYSILYNFGANSIDAQYPLGGPAIGANGNLYGITSGGKNGMGTVFKLTPAGQEIILHNFGDNADDGYDATDLIFGPNGNLYGTTFGGGARQASGTLFEVTTSGAYSIRFSFDYYAPPPSNASDPISLAFDAKGNLYGTALLVGNSDWGGVFKLSRGAGKDWVETVPITFSASPEGYVPNTPLIFDQVGNMYGTTDGGGATGYGTVWELTAGGEVTPLLNFDTTVGYSPDGSLLLDASGNLYGTTYFGGSGNTTMGGGTLFKIVR